MAKNSVGTAQGRIVRPTWPLRVGAVLQGVITCSLLGVVSVAAVATASWGALLAVPLFVLDVWFSTRQVRVSLQVQDSELVVRNRFRTLRIPRGDIDEFRPGTWSFASMLGGVVAVDRHGVETGLDATAFSTITGIGRGRQDRLVVELTAWLTEGSGFQYTNGAR